MGEKVQEALKLQFDRRLRLEFHGARITSCMILRTGQRIGVDGEMAPSVSHGPDEWGGSYV